MIFTVSPPSFRNLRRKNDSFEIDASLNYTRLNGLHFSVRFSTGYYIPIAHKKKYKWILTQPRYNKFSPTNPYNYTLLRNTLDRECRLQYYFYEIENAVVY